MNKQGILHAILPTLILLLVVFSVLPGCSPPPFPKFMPPPPMAPADAGGVPTSAPHADGQGEGREWIPPVPSAQQDAARQENAANNRHTEENGRTEEHTGRQGQYLGELGDHQQPSSQPSPSDGQQRGILTQWCEGNGSFKLDTFPLDVGNIELIVPMGRVQNSHVTPTDHQYIIPKETKSKSLVTDDPYRYEVRAPADGYIINIELFKEPVEINYQDQPYINNYLVFFEHSCTFYTRLIHIDTLAPDIEAKVEFRNAESQHPNAFPRIPVKKGQAIGTVGPHSFDFQIMDTSIKNKFIAPEHTQTWTLYTVDTFDYLAEPLRSALLAKNIKMTEPYGGKIMYDKDGTLLGNWRRIGRDASNSQYWQDDLSIVYDHIDPSQIQVSIGNFGGSPQAFSVRGNAPAPESVNKEKGMVVYGLAETKYYTESGELWDEIRFAKLSAKNSDYLVGTVAFQLESDRVLKMEAFPGKTADDVRGFTEKVVRYER